MPSTNIIVIVWRHRFDLIRQSVYHHYFQTRKASDFFLSSLHHNYSSVHLPDVFQCVLDDSSNIFLQNQAFLTAFMEYIIQKALNLVVI